MDATFSAGDIAGKKKKLSESIKAEATEKNIGVSEPCPAYNLGLAICILNCFFIIPVLGTIAAIGLFICWILYWLKIASYKKLLAANQYNTIGFPN